MTMLIVLFALIALIFAIQTAIIWGIHMDATEVQAKIVALKASVDSLIAIPSQPTVDLQPLGDAVDAIKAEVDIAVAAKSVPAT